MLLLLSDTLGTAAYFVKLLTVSLRSTGFRNVVWVGLAWVNKYGPMSISGLSSHDGYATICFRSICMV